MLWKSDIFATCKYHQARPCGIVSSIKQKEKKTKKQNLQFFRSSVSNVPAACSSRSVSLHVLKPAVDSLQTPHPSPSLLPASTSLSLTHSLSHSEATSAATLSSVCVPSICVFFCLVVFFFPPHLEQCIYSTSRMWWVLLCFWFQLVQIVWAGDVTADTNAAVFPQDCSLDCIQQVGSMPTPHYPTPPTPPPPHPLLRRHLFEGVWNLFDVLDPRKF